LTQVCRKDALRELVLAYVPVHKRRALAALFSLDDTLAAIPRSTTEPVLGQMRLLWWREALVRLDVEAPAAEPVLQALAVEALPLGITGSALSRMVDGWEVLIEASQLGEAALIVFGEGRGRLFDLAGVALGAVGSDPLHLAGPGWALADLGQHLRDQHETELAMEIAKSRLDAAMRVRWSRNARALGALTHLARMEIDPNWARSSAFSKTGRLLWHRLTGR
jgi:15-cis-phytoene synthase